VEDGRIDNASVENEDTENYTNDDYDTVDNDEYATIEQYIASDDEDEDSVKVDDWRSRFGRSIGEHKAALLDIEAFETEATDYIFQQVDTDTAFHTTSAVDNHTTTAAYDAAMDTKFLDSDRTAEIERLLTLNASYANHTPALKVIL